MKKVILAGAGILAVVAMVGAVVWSAKDQVKNEILVASVEAGGIGDHVVGSSDAPVVIYEYADYQCEHCASLNAKLNDLMDEYDGKVALVFRLYIQNYHKNSTAAASAAEAAGLQGYWQEYKDLLFLHRSDWAEADPAMRQELFEQYFKVASDEEGDLEKFREDMESENVAKKLEFDQNLAKKVGLAYTPLLFVNDIRIEQDEMGLNLMRTLREKIDFSLNL